jgi:hypothetical protein
MDKRLPRASSPDHYRITAKSTIQRWNSEQYIIDPETIHFIAPLAQNLVTFASQFLSAMIVTRLKHNRRSSVWKFSLISAGFVAVGNQPRILFKWYWSTSIR